MTLHRGRNALPGRFVSALALVMVGAVTVSTLAHDSFAQSPAAKRVEVIHKAPLAKSLPPAASMMPISIELKNTRALDHKIRLVGSRDGKLIDIVFPLGTLNLSDVPTYKLEIPAPIAALTYQFVVHQSDGTLTTTPQFTIKRACIQSFKVDVPDDTKDASFKREVATLVSRARTLEQETQDLETALKLLDEIKSNLP